MPNHRLNDPIEAIEKAVMPVITSKNGKPANSVHHHSPLLILSSMLFTKGLYHIESRSSQGQDPKCWPSIDGHSIMRKRPLLDPLTNLGSMRLRQGPQVEEPEASAGSETSGSANF